MLENVGFQKWLKLPMTWLILQVSKRSNWILTTAAAFTQHSCEEAQRNEDQQDHHFAAKYGTQPGCHKLKKPLYQSLFEYFQTKCHNYPSWHPTVSIFQFRSLQRSKNLRFVATTGPYHPSGASISEFPPWAGPCSEGSRTTWASLRSKRLKSLVLPLLKLWSTKEFGNRSPRIFFGSSKNQCSITHLLILIQNNICDWRLTEMPILGTTRNVRLRALWVEGGAQQAINGIPTSQPVEKKNYRQRSGKV